MEPHDSAKKPQLSCNITDLLTLYLRWWLGIFASQSIEFRRGLLLPQDSNRREPVESMTCAGQVVSKYFRLSLMRWAFPIRVDWREWAPNKLE